VARQIRIEVRGPNLDEETRSRVAQALKERIGHSPEILGKIEISDAARPPAPGERAFGSIITGVILVKMSDWITDVTLEATKKAVGEVIEKFVAQQFEHVIIRIFGEDGKEEKTFESKPKPDDARPKVSRKYAILIANQTYGEGSGVKNLNFCCNDVDRIRDVLIRCPDQFSDDSIVVLKDKNHWEIEAELDSIIKNAKDDFLLIYYSGHGLPHPTLNKLFITARNSKADKLSVTAIEYDSIISLIKQIFARSVGIILDCCYAGMAKEGFRGDPRASMHAANDTLNQEGRSFAVITASSATELAKEGQGAGIVTNIIANGIESGEAATQTSGRVTFPGLLSFIKAKIPLDVYQTPDYAQVGPEIVLVNTGCKSGRSGRNWMRFVLS
jgi:hypothetical protein